MTRELTMMLVVMLALGVSFATANPSHPITRAQEKTTCGLEVKGYYTQGQPIVLRISLQNHSYEPSVVISWKECLVKFTVWTGTTGAGAAWKASAPEEVEAIRIALARFPAP